MDFRNDRFVVEAYYRQVASVGDVRAIKVDVPELWSQAQTGWNEIGRGFPLARTNGNFYVDPLKSVTSSNVEFQLTMLGKSGEM